MAEQVLIRALDHPDEFEWLLASKSGEPLGHVGRGGPEQLAKVCRKRQAILVVRATDVLLTQVRLPVRNAAAIAKALPYALEDQLAEDVESLHFARGRQDAQGVMSVAVIARQRLDDYLQQLEQVGIKPEHIFPESLLLPLQEGGWSLLLEDDRVLLRSGLAQGMGLDSDSMKPVLEHLLASREEGALKIQAWSCGEPSLEAEQLSLPGAQVETMPASPSALALLARGLEGGGPLDLLQGEYRKGGSALGSFKTWLPAVAMLVIALLIQLAGMGYGYWELMQREQVLKGEVEALFRETFPETRRLVDARAQADHKLAELKSLRGEGGDRFLGLLHASGQELIKEKGLSLTGLSYKGGVLQLRLNSKDLSQLEGFKQRLEQVETHRLQIKVLSAVSREEGVDARVQIKEQAS